MKRTIYLLVMSVLFLSLVPGCRDAKGTVAQTQPAQTETMDLFRESVDLQQNPALSWGDLPRTDSDLTQSDSVLPEDADSAGDEESEITLIMVGDMLMHTPVTDSGLQEDGSYDYTHLFTYTKDMIEEADLALVNQEVILGGTQLGLSGYPSFNAPY